MNKKILINNQKKRETTQNGPCGSFPDYSTTSISYNHTYVSNLTSDLSLKNLDTIVEKRQNEYTWQDMFAMLFA